MDSRPLNNIKSSCDSYDNIGRLNDIVNVSKLIINNKMKAANKSFSVLNLYGPLGVGKKTLMIEVANLFIIKNVFPDGIYMIDCSIVHK